MGKKIKKKLKKRIYKALTKDDGWHIKKSKHKVCGDDMVQIRRLYKGRVVESYAPLPVDKAAVYIMAIIQGYQPPRGLYHLDKPSG